MIEKFGFWAWFFRGVGSKPGYRRILNLWLILHFGISAVICIVVSKNLNDSANVVLLPLAGILIGLTFAWAGNAQALMESKEIQALSDYHEGGFIEYVFTFQTAILAILVTLIFWCFAGLSVFDDVWPTPSRVKSYLLIKFILFSAASLTIRECWHVIMGAQWMLLLRMHIRRSGKDTNTDKEGS